MIVQRILCIEIIVQMMVLNGQFRQSDYLCRVKNQRTIAYHTLGCKLNFAETSSIGRQFSEAGYAKVNFNEVPDVFLINTCSVTENANRECRSIVSKALNINPKAIIAITGCFAQLKPDEIASIPGVDLVLGASEKFNAPEYLQSLMVKGDTMIKSCEIANVNHFESSWSIGDRTRVFLKVQDGCDYNCSFCTIPLARGKSRSNTIENVIHEANQIVQSGAMEIVLTGINLGDFGIYDAVEHKRDSTFYQLI
jgi:threonylcarbamoyladenosine tRNA methylthiotransferase MtaB